MALANFAWILAMSGRKVLVIDWDLEAPGLHRYLRPFLVDPDLEETDGLIDTFWRLAEVTMANVPSEFSKSSETSATRYDEAIVDAIEDGIRRLDWPQFPDGAHIDFIGAGRQGPTYSERVNTFDWKRFYELGGVRLLATVKEHVSSQYDWVLIDSRTGVSDTSGICTIQMPSIVVACFTLNRQSIDGVAAILRSIRAYRSPSVDGSKIQFFPVAMRIENGEQRRLERARRYARPLLIEFLPSYFSQSNAREYWDQMEISYRPAYAFEEVLAAFADATDVAAAADSMLSQVKSMSQCITRDSALEVLELGEADRAAVLEKYTFATTGAPLEETLDRSVEDSAGTDFLRGLRAKEREWRRSDFDWRLLLSRRELDLLTDEDRTQFGRSMSFYVAQSEKTYPYLRTIDLTFVIMLVASAASTFLVASFAVSNHLVRSYQDLISIAFAAVLLLFMLIWVLGGAIVGRAPGKPYGLRLLQVLSLTLRGPFRSEIHDYKTRDSLLRNSS